MWRDAWQRLASSYPTPRWDVAVNVMVTAAGRCSLSYRQKHRNLQLVNCSSLSQTFCPPNSLDLNTVTCHLGCSSFSRRSTIIKVFPQLTKLREQLSKSWQKLPHGAVIANSSLLSPFYLRLMLFTRWHHYFPRLIQINDGMMFSMKRTWFMPNLVKIRSIFLKL